MGGGRERGGRAVLMTRNGRRAQPSPRSAVHAAAHGRRHRERRPAAAPRPTVTPELDLIPQLAGESQCLHLTGTARCSIRLPNLPDLSGFCNS